MKIYNGSSWQEAKGLRFFNGGSWTPAVKGWVFTGSGWMQHYPNFPELFSCDGSVSPTGPAGPVAPVNA